MHTKLPWVLEFDWKWLHEKRFANPMIFNGFFIAHFQGKVEKRLVGRSFTHVLRSLFTKLSTDFVDKLDFSYRGRELAF